MASVVAQHGTAPGYGFAAPRVGYIDTSETVKPGYAVCYAASPSTAEDDGALVEKPSVSNVVRTGGNGGFAGVIISAADVREGSRRKVVYAPWQGTPVQNTTVLTDRSITEGDVLGPVPGSWYFRKSPFAAGFIARETVDRSSTAGTVRGDFGYDPNIVEAFNEQVWSEKISWSQRANTATSDVNGAHVVADAGGVQGLDIASGKLSIRSDGDDNDEAYVGFTDKVLKCDPNKPWWVEGIVDLTEAATDDANFVWGVTSTSPASLANFLVDNGAGPPSNYSGAVFFKVDGGTVIQAESSNFTTQSTDTDVGAFTSGSEHALRIVWDGSNLTFWIGGTLVHTASSAGTPLAAIGMALVFGVKSGGANEEDLNVHNVTVKAVL